LTGKLQWNLIIGQFAKLRHRDVKKRSARSIGVSMTAGMPESVFITDHQREYLLEMPMELENFNAG